MCTGTPFSVRPSTTVSIDETTSPPIPYPASTARCPSAVPPPCDPIAGTMNGDAPASRSPSTIAVTTSRSGDTPRLPTATATRAPRRMGSRASPDRMAPRRSATSSAGKFCRTRTRRG